MSDLGESEAEALNRNFLLRRLNATLKELLHACDGDRDIDKCDEVMGTLLSAVRGFQVIGLVTHTLKISIMSSCELTAPSNE